MLKREPILDLVTVWFTFLHFSAPDDRPKLLLADVFIDFILVVIGALQLRQTIVRGHEVARYENFAVTIYLLLMMDALAGDCKELALHRGWLT